MELKDTVERMKSVDYKDRFIAEYLQIKIRYEKLKNFCDRIELAEKYGAGEAPKHDCPLDLLREQQKCMGMYLGCLEKRAIVEGIELNPEMRNVTNEEFRKIIGEGIGISAD